MLYVYLVPGLLVLGCLTCLVSGNLVEVGITWEDAPTEQFARLNNDYKIRCVVRANPPANIDWLKESFIISTGNQFVIESDGLLIKNVDKENSGTYTCRARVAQTGELEERDIVLDVQEPPRLALEPSDVRGVEMDKAEFKCNKTLDKILAELEKTNSELEKTNTELEKLTEQVGELTALLPQPTTMPPMPSICTNYTTLSDSWRHIDYDKRRSSSVTYTDRIGKGSHYNRYSQLTKKWYRFSGSAGRQLPTTPARGGPPDTDEIICQTYSTGYILSGGNPNLQDGIVTREVCFEQKYGIFSRCLEKKTINMAACQDRDKNEMYFVYELEPVDNYNTAYCAIE